MSFTCNDIRGVAFERINERFSKGKYLGVEVTIDMTNGYINGPHLVGQVKTSGGRAKLFSHWRETKESKEIIRFISQNEGINIGALVISVDDVPNGLRGGYVHPYLVPHVAHWASPALAHIMGRILNYIAINVDIPKLYTDPRIDPAPGCVYLVSDGVYVKIGYTYDLPKRLQSLQTGNSRELTIIGRIICFDPVNVEKKIHAEYASKKVRGEWFVLTSAECEDIVKAYS